MRKFSQIKQKTKIKQTNIPNGKKDERRDVLHRLLPMQSAAKKSPFF